MATAKPGKNGRNGKENGKRGVEIYSNILIHEGWQYLTAWTCDERIIEMYRIVFPEQRCLRKRTDDLTWKCHWGVLRCLGLRLTYIFNGFHLRGLIGKLYLQGLVSSEEDLFLKKSLQNNLQITTLQRCTNLICRNKI